MGISDFVFKPCSSYKAQDIQDFLSTIKLSKTLTKKIVNFLCAYCDIPRPKITLRNIDHKLYNGLYFPTTKAIQLFKPAHNVDILVHEVCHHVRFEMGLEKIASRTYHGKSFWLHYTFLFFLIQPILRGHLRKHGLTK